MSDVYIMMGQNAFFLLHMCVLYVRSAVDLYDVL